MAITELVFPAVKTSPEDVKTFKQTWPTLSKTFEEHPDVPSGFYGWVVEENGTDVKGASKFVLVLGMHLPFSYTLSTGLSGLSSLNASEE